VPQKPYLTTTTGEYMSYLDTLNTMNLKDDTDIDIVFTASADVWFTDDVGEYDVLVNKTNAFEAWWEYMNLDTNREDLQYFVEDDSHIYNMNGYHLKPDDEGYSYEDDRAGAYLAVKENPGDLFDFAECETIRFDHKRGQVRGQWTSFMPWWAVREAEDFWQWVQKYASNLELSVRHNGKQVTLAP
jgi:hypothetical protein